MSHCDPDPELTFEEALARLEQIARLLEDGNLGLDESLASYEEGIRHLKTCNRLLERAERKIELLSGVDAQGNPIVQPFDDATQSLEEKADSRSRRRTAGSSKVRQPRQSAGDEEEEDRLDEPPRLF